MSAIMCQMRANFYARPSEAILGPPTLLRGVLFRPLVAPSGSPLALVDYFNVSFEDIFERLCVMPGADAEPDGFFVVNGGNSQTSWRISGQLFDFGGRMHRMELHGNCPTQVVEQLWGCLGWPEAAIACELIYEGVTLDESAFRSWATLAPEVSGAP